MRKISQEVDDLLWGYLAGTLDSDKVEKLEKGLSNSEDLQRRLEALQLMQSVMSDTQLLHPSSNFTKRVMSNLHQAPVPSVVTPKNGLILLCGVLVALGIAATMVDVGFFNSLNGILSLNKINMPKGVNTLSLPSIALNGKLIINSIIAINLGLAFLILDRTVLKPFFNKRSRMQY